MKKVVSLSAAVLMVFSGLATSAMANQTKNLSFFTVGTSTTGYTKIINDLTHAYVKKNPGTVALSIDYQPQASSDQKLQILAASNQIPTIYNVNAPSLQEQMIKAGDALNMAQTFKSLGIYNDLLPSAVKLEEQESGGKGLYSLPMELNIEGFWYNKKLFAKYHLAIPMTWAVMMNDAKILKSHGIQPFAADGKDGWPLTRLIGGYALRYYGPNVMKLVSEGKLKLTDPGFVKAAQAVQTMGKAGYFGPGVATIDYNTALDEFLQGKTGMYYMGSWELGDFNNPSLDKIGVKNVGLFNIPLVPGGKGNLSNWEMNTGIANGFSKSQYDATEGKWMKDVFSNYGNTAMSELGQISGFKVSKLPKSTTALTKNTLNTLNHVKTGSLWFEAYFSPKATTYSQQQVQLLVTGAMTPQTFLSGLQSANQ